MHKHRNRKIANRESLHYVRQVHPNVIAGSRVRRSLEGMATSAFGRRFPLATNVTALLRCLRSMNKELLAEVRPWYGDYSGIGVLR